MKLFQFREQRQPVAGLDLGSDAVRIVQLEREAGATRVRRYISLPWPEGMSPSDIRRNPTRLGEILGEMLANQDVNLGSVVCALPISAIFLKRLKSPNLPWSELKSYVELEAISVVPPSGGAVCIDFQILRKLPDGNLELLLVAAKQEALDTLTQTMVASGLDVPIIDVDVFAAHNAFEAFSQSSLDRSTAIIHLGLRSSNISLRSSGQLMFAGDLESSVESVCELLADALRMNQSESRRVLFTESNDGSQFQPALTEVLRSVSDDIARRLNLIWQIADLSEPIDSIVICGEGAHIPNLRRFLEDLTNRTVLPFDPLTALSADGEDAFTTPSSFTIAIGLALRSPGDRVVSLGGNDDND